MKTFLHYTKEKQLNETRFFDRLAGIGGNLVGGLAKVNRFASVTRGLSDMIADRKAGSRFGAVGSAASGIQAFAKNQRNQTNQMNSKLVEINRQIEILETNKKEYHAKLSKYTPSDPKYGVLIGRIKTIDADIATLEQKRIDIAKSKNQEELENLENASVGTEAENIKNKLRCLRKLMLH